MKNISKLLFICLFSLSLGLYSCGDDEPEDPSETCLNSITSYSDAFSNFLDSESEANCNAVKDAALSLVNDCNLEEFLPSLGLTQDQWNTVLDSLTNVSCTP